MNTKIRLAAPSVTGLVNEIWLVLFCALAALTQWPIYRGTGFVIVAGVSVVCAWGITRILAKWQWWMKTLAALVIFVILGVPIAVPQALVSFPNNIVDGYRVLFSSLVSGWRQILTLQLPLGSFQGVLVPAFVVLFVTALLIFSFGKLQHRLYPLAAVACGLACLYGLFFGRSLNTFPAIVIALVALALVMAWLVWRVAVSRRGSVGKIRVNSSPVAALRRGVLGAVMVAAAMIAAVTLSPVVAGQSKTVGRTLVTPETVSPTAQNPLSGLRAFFTDDRYDQLLATTTGGVSQLRLATLPYYTGVGFQAEANHASFQRVPSTIPVSGPKRTATITVRPGWSGTVGEWMPLPGQLHQVQFISSPQLALSKYFAYDRSTLSGVQRLTRDGSVGLAGGDQYKVDYAPMVLSENVEAPGHTQLIDGGTDQQTKALREAIGAWVNKARQAGDPDIASVPGVKRLIQKLYWAGQLSRSAYIGSNPKWAIALRQEPQRSFAGENVQRMQDVFSDLSKSSKQCTGPDDHECAAVYGDEEQFATAAALVARYAGFDSRVVMGWNLGLGAKNVYSKDTTAWVEFGNQSDDQWTSMAGTRIPVDNKPPEVDKKPDLKKYEYDSAPKNANAVNPPEPKPGASAGSSAKSEASAGVPEWVWASARIVGVSLLGLIILCAPFLAIVFAKRQRTKARRLTPDPNNRIAGGWDEYLDLASDYGAQLPRNATRSHTAKSLGHPVSYELARVADQAVFSNQQAQTSLSDQCWQVVDSERKRLASTSTRWQRVRAALNIGTFLAWMPSGTRTFSVSKLAEKAGNVLHGRNKNGGIFMEDHKGRK